MVEKLLAGEINVMSEEEPNGVNSFDELEWVVGLIDFLTLGKSG